ncbi:MAG: hypothetical protein GF393_08095, partial [Armatimonadia bacterium]|nr:hypothetical protein [Armatimonadia bacterium]
MNTTARMILLSLGLLVLFAAGLGMRYAVWHAQEETLEAGEELPFTLESALQFRLTRMVYT